MSEQQRPMVNAYGYTISQSVHAWADWARKLLAEKSETAARAIASGKQSRWISDQEIARRQVEESRADRAIMDMGIPAPGRGQGEPAPTDLAPAPR